MPFVQRNPTRSAWAARLPVHVHQLRVSTPSSLLVSAVQRLTLPAACPLLLWPNIFLLLSSLSCCSLCCSARCMRQDVCKLARFTCSLFYSKIFLLSKLELFHSCQCSFLLQCQPCRRVQVRLLEFILSHFRGLAAFQCSKCMHITETYCCRVSVSQRGKLI